MRRRLSRARLVALVSMMAIAVAQPAAAIEPGVRPPFVDPIEYLGPEVRPKDRGVWVTELHKALRRAGFSIYDREGVYGWSTAAAVRVFSKVHNISDEPGFEARSWELLVDGTPVPGPGGEDHRIEIDLSRQIMYLVENSDVKAVLPVSTASGGKYENFFGQIVTARTPEGRFELYNRRFGWYESYLGEMYNPFYFTGGYAIHGSPSVPWYPASHGCVRVRMSDMRWLKERLEIGIPVYVYGRRLERQDVVPIPRLIPLEDIIERFAA
ncbi:MAG: L,D-transpeptidase family protein [Acidimicrobiia bacterium]